MSGVLNRDILMILTRRSQYSNQPLSPKEYALLVGGLVQRTPRYKNFIGSSNKILYGPVMPVSKIFYEFVVIIRRVRVVGGITLVYVRSIFNAVPQDPLLSGMRVRS